MEPCILCGGALPSPDPADVLDDRSHWEQREGVWVHLGCALSQEVPNG